MNQKLVWIASLCAQALVLCGLVAREERALKVGVPVLIEVRAVDPMDLLSGRYISVPLAISTVDLDLTIHPTPVPDKGEFVFAHLERQINGPCKLVEFARAPGDPRAGPWARALVDTQFDESNPNEILRLDFQVERFYIPQTGSDPSMSRRADGTRHEICVAARVAPDGRILIEDLLVDGQAYAQWNAQQVR